MKTTSRIAMVAAAGLMMGGFVVSAKAADLGGNCCADLEERVAELEATTARKGNRKVSLEVSGQVNRALLVWDDGIDSDAYVVDNDFSDTRVRFRGSATMKPGWKAGFIIELAFNDAATDEVFQGKAGDEANRDDSRTLQTRLANWYIESEKLGRITVGKVSEVADGIVDIDLSKSYSVADALTGSDFRIRTGPTSSIADTVARVDDYTGIWDGGRDDLIRYDSPSIYGFILSAAWGDNDYFDAGVRFQKEWNSVRIAAGVAYAWDGEGTTSPADSNITREKVVGSLSVMHIPTGIFVTFAAGEQDAESLLASQDEERDFWYIKAGLERKFLSYGTTTFYGEYAEYNGEFGTGASATVTRLGGIAETETNRFGFGVVQSFDAVAMDVYANFSFYEFDNVLTNGRSEDLEDMSFGLVGARIRF